MSRISPRTCIGSCMRSPCVEFHASSTTNRLLFGLSCFCFARCRRCLHAFGHARAPSTRLDAGQGWRGAYSIRIVAGSMLHWWLVAPERDQRNFRRRGPSLARLLPTACETHQRQNPGQLFWRHQPRSCRPRPSLVDHGPLLPQLGLQAVDFGRSRPTQRCFDPSLARMRPAWVRCSPMW